MNELILLTDGSVNTQTKIGFGAYLAVPEPKLSLEEFGDRVKVKRFEQTTSTKLELQTLLWALNDLQATQQQLIIYTDSQNIIGLPARREGLEQADFRSQKNTRLRNYHLYQEFYRLTEQFDCKFVKVRGHLAGKEKDNIDRLFSLVDKTARKFLRKEKSSR